jgi:phenylpropionate dioxygenase-like ring-hydroxylating dioxygenase large terminal subunit
MALDFPHPIPLGWFALRPSKALAPGALEVVRAFGQDLVIWRSASGVVSVAEAFCPHLGAHLGHGGRVEGERIRCPFHGWSFDTEGTCREIPYARRVPPGACLKTFPVLERNGALWIWHATDGRGPFYEIPPVAECTREDWQPVHRSRWTIATQIQEMAENGVDAPHFQTVHGATGLPESEIRVEGATRTALQKAPLQTGRGAATSEITVTNVGLGFSFTRFTGLIETTTLNFVLPRDAHTIELSVVFLQPRAEIGSRGMQAIIADLQRQIEEDIPIWENKIYRPRPVLSEGDGPITEFRRWCRQFYVEAR